MDQRTIAIGDIHGCAIALAALLDAIEPQPEDTIVTLGDYIDRGPDSRGVMERLLQLEKQCNLIPLLGNHEVMMMASREDSTQQDYWLQFGGRETLDSYGESDVSLDEVPDAHFEFIGRCVIYHQTEDYIFVHANYAPNLPLEKQSEMLLLWEHLGQSEPKPHCSGKTVIVGHTPQFDGEVQDRGHLVALDTFCFGGGWLTAMDVHSRKLWQADINGKLREA